MLGTVSAFAFGHRQIKKPMWETNKTSEKAIKTREKPRKLCGKPWKPCEKPIKPL